MALRFYRRVRLLPGLRVNLSRSGVSASVGRRGAWVTFGRRGTRSTVGLPGTGLSYSALSRRTRWLLVTGVLLLALLIALMRL